VIPIHSKCWWKNCILLLFCFCLFSLSVLGVKFMLLYLLCVIVSEIQLYLFQCKLFPLPRLLLLLLPPITPHTPSMHRRIVLPFSVEEVHFHQSTYRNNRFVGVYVTCVVCSRFVLCCLFVSILYHCTDTLFCVSLVSKWSSLFNR